MGKLKELKEQEKLIEQLQKEIEKLKNDLEAQELVEAALMISISKNLSDEKAVKIIMDAMNH